MTTLNVSGDFGSLRDRLSEIFADAAWEYGLGAYPTFGPPDPFADDKFGLSVSDINADPDELLYLVSFEGPFLTLTVDEQSGFVDTIVFMSFAPPSLQPSYTFEITNATLFASNLYNALNEDAGPFNDGGATTALILRDVDEIVGSGGADFITSDGSDFGLEYRLGGGSDVFTFLPDHEVEVLGGGGFDTLVLKQTTGLSLQAINAKGSLRYEITPDFEPTSEFIGFEAVVKQKGSLHYTGTTLAEDVTTGSGKDRLEGRGGNDVLSSGSNADVLLGGSGSDILDPGRGNDSIDGGTGSDTLSYASITDGTATINLKTGTATGTRIGTDSFRNIEKLTATGSDDTIIGSNDADLIRAGDGDDTIRANEGRDRVFGGSGDDRIGATRNDDKLFGGSGHDNMTGGRGNDWLDGDSGNDLLSGGRGNDRLIGDGGDDTLVGAQGADRLVGGAGNDRLIGGSNADTFVFNQSSGDDFITDFGLTQDMLELNGTLSSLSRLDLAGLASDTEAGLLLQLGEGVSVTLRGLTTSDIDALLLN